MQQRVSTTWISLARRDRTCRTPESAILTSSIANAGRAVEAACAPANTDPPAGHRPATRPGLPSRAGLRGLQAQPLGNARAKNGVHLGPVIVDGALLDGALHPLAQVPDDVADQAVAGRVVEYVPDQTRRHTTPGPAAL